MCLEIRATNEDVGKYLDGRMLELPEFVRRNLELREEIMSKIVPLVKGMFLLAQLHLNSLMGKISVNGIRTALTKLPTGSGAYHEAYESAMERIEHQVEEQRDLAKRVLSWITCARRQLIKSELEHALAVKPGNSELDEDDIPQTIVEVCAGLVTVDEHRHVVRLVHYTAQQYFEKTQEQWVPNVETDLARTCATYLSFTAFRDESCQTEINFRERLRSNPLYDYAACNWGHHAREAPTLCEEVTGFLNCEEKVEASLKALVFAEEYRGNIWRFEDLPWRTTGLHGAAYFGFQEAASSLLEHAYGEDMKDSHGRTSLLWAAERGHETIVKLLLATEGVEINSKDNDSQTPLFWASEKGHETIVKLLLTTDGVEVDPKDNDGRTPLHIAAANGDKTIVSLLLNTRGVDPDSEDINGTTPLSWAAMNGCTEMVNLLLTSGKVNPNFKTTGKYYPAFTPLHYAAFKGHYTVSKLLLGAKGVDPDIKDYRYERTPLSVAAERGNVEVVKLLLANNEVDPDSKTTTYGDYYKDYKGRTPLSFAAEMGHVEVVKLLLDSGKVDANSESKSGRTPLSYAAEDGHEGVIKLLLDIGKVKVNSKTPSGRTPLSYSTEKGHEAVIKLLLATGKVDLDSNGDQGHALLLYAVNEGNETIVKLLLGIAKVDVDLGCDRCQKLLSAVRLKDHPEKLAEFLIKFLAMDAQGNAGDTIKELIIMAASDSELVEGLEKLREEMDQKFE